MRSAACIFRLFSGSSRTASPLLDRMQWCHFLSREVVMRIVAACCVLLSPALALAQPRVGPEPKQWEETVDKALAYLKQSQDAQGSWSGNKSPGVTGVVLTGVLDCKRTSADDEMAAKALKYIESLINPKAKHIAGNDPKVQ